MPMFTIVTGVWSKVVDVLREKMRDEKQGAPLTVEAAMSSPAVTCHPDTPLSEVAHLMWTRSIGFLPVVARDSGRVVGAITDRDALMGAYTQGKPLWEVPASVSMSRGVQTCRPDLPLEEAVRTMGANHVHRLPVVDAGQRLVGVLSLDDVARKASATANEALEQGVAVALDAIRNAAAASGTPALH